MTKAQEALNNIEILMRDAGLVDTDDDDLVLGWIQTVAKELDQQVLASLEQAATNYVLGSLKYGLPKEEFELLLPALTETRKLLKKGV